jgi:hypothetical protein
MATPVTESIRPKTEVLGAALLGAATTWGLQRWVSCIPLHIITPQGAAIALACASIAQEVCEPLPAILRTALTALAGLYGPMAFGFAAPWKEMVIVLIAPAAAVMGAIALGVTGVFLAASVSSLAQNLLSPAQDPL